ncbi:MAG: putative bifunctional diguanylate cyclase/phosphodiesterase, partial [Chloroflexota bacterium]
MIAAALTLAAGAAMVGLRMIVGSDVVIALPWPMVARVELYWIFVIAVAVLVYRLVRRVIIAARRERAALRRANRTHALLRRISGAVLRIHEERELLSEVCDASVEAGGYTASWIGLVDGTDGTVRPAAAAGRDESPLSIETAPEENAVLRAVMSGNAAVTSEVSPDSAAEAGRSTPGRGEVKAFAAFPLKIRDAVVGVLVLCSSEAGVFDSDELRVLDEVALTTAVGLAYVRAEKELHHRVFYHRVTGYAHRPLFIDRLQQFMTRAPARRKVVAVLLFEISNYRTLVDAFGWQAGDEAMRALGTYLGSRIRSGDTIGTIASHCLGVGLVDLAREDHTVRVLRKITNDLKLRIRVGEQFAPVSVLVSVAVYPRDGETAKELVRNAEDALRDGIRHPDLPGVFCARGADRHHEKRKNLGARLEMEEELSSAIARGELELVFQPIVELPGGAFVGAESLLRWNSRRFGKVSPGTFIPVAESGALLERIDTWVIRSVLELVAGDDNPIVGDRTITVNVSADELLGTDFPLRVEGLMHESGLTPERNRVGLEVTERMLLGDFSRAVDVLNALRQLGFTIYLDDFGTGYSSLSYLQRLPVDVVKCDRTFLVHLDRDEKACSLVDAIVRMSHGLGLPVVAEGIESSDVLRIVTEMGCDMAQGFAIARPVSLEHLPVSVESACRTLPTLS